MVSEGVSVAGGMGPEEIEAKLREFDKRLRKMDERMFAFQVGAAKKLAEALAILQKHQAARDAKVHQALKQLLSELTDIRNRLADVVGPRITH